MFTNLHFTWGTGNWIALGVLVVMGVAWLVLSLRSKGGGSNTRR